jgi:inosine-uridine nucleoside N-ribohydrolase
MAGLDVTHQFLATPERIARIAAMPGRLAAIFADLLTFFSSSYIGRHDDIAGAPMHDPLAVLALTAPELFGLHARHVGIETHGALTRGMTVIDQRTLRERAAPNCDVLSSVDADAAFTLLADAIHAYSR